MLGCSSYSVVYRVKRNRREFFITTEGIVRTTFPHPIIYLWIQRRTNHSPFEITNRLRTHMGLDASLGNHTYIMKHQNTNWCLNIIVWMGAL